MKPPYRVLLAASTIALVSCAADGEPQAAACASFTTALAVKDRMSQTAATFNPNEPITFELKISNTANAPATLTAATSCMAATFEVFDAAGRRLWGNADGIACLMMLQPRTYSPFETVVESSTWNQTDATRAAVPPGTYEVTASVGAYVSDPQLGQLVDCRADLSRAAQFVIQ